jgi:hypothetical protein
MLSTQEMPATPTSEIAELTEFLRKQTYRVLIVREQLYGKIADLRGHFPVESQNDVSASKEGPLPIIPDLRASLADLERQVNLLENVANQTLSI